MLLGIVSIEPGGSKVVKADFSALADRLGASVQRTRRESAIIPFCRVIGTIWAPESGCVVIGSAPLQNPRSIPKYDEVAACGLICCRRACGGSRVLAGSTQVRKSSAD